MKERPILFSGPMVRAILAGDKTQTRRVIKPQPVRLADNPSWPTHAWGDAEGGGYWVAWHQNDMTATEAIGEYCPYGKPGDFLWVRETHLVTAGGAVLYKADHPDLISGYCRPSIHMLRQHSRITLEVTSVRVQRLQDISHEDGKAEGFDSLDGFALLWDRINAKRGYGWQANPYVWAVEFRAVKA
jgi:hypothetical protein